jgi:hypothetical protein
VAGVVCRRDELAGEVVAVQPAPAVAQQADGRLGREDAAGATARTGLRQSR